MNVADLEDAETFQVRMQIDDGHIDFADLKIEAFHKDAKCHDRERGSNGQAAGCLNELAAAGRCFLGDAGGDAAIEQVDQVRGSSCEQPELAGSVNMEKDGSEKCWEAPADHPGVAEE